MKKIILLLFGVLSPYIVFPQGENNNWYFGNKTGVTFNTNPPAALFDSEMNTEEGVATISKPSGELLFYTNGQTIWNREHQIMQNGDGLTAQSSTQQVVILPHPGNTNQYYVFTMSDLDLLTNISYSVVDMNLGGLGANNEPLGGIITNQKNIPILDETSQPLAYHTEAVTTLLHSDKQSYWVLIPNGTKLYSYRLDTSGFINNPVTSNLTLSQPFSSHGQIKASPNLPPDLELPYSNLISISQWEISPPEFKVYSFDNDTGLLTSDYILTLISDAYYSSEYNSNGTILYAARLFDGGIFAVDLFSENPNPPKELISGWAAIWTGGTLQRAVDNNIYFCIRLGYVLYLISNPDSYIDSSFNQYDPDNISLGGIKSRWGLPQLIPMFCKDNLILNTPEVSQNMLYKVSNTITVGQNYKVNSDQDIILSAGNMIEILPDVHIGNGSVFRAMIEGCSNSANRKYGKIHKNTKPVRITINLDENGLADLKIYPNPATDIINVSSSVEVIESVTITDMNGRVIKQMALGVNEGQINISDLPQGVYILNTVLNGKSVTEKIVKK